MKTLKELKDFCSKNGIRYELIEKFGSEIYDFDGNTHRPIMGWYFGMNNIAGRKGLSEWSWTWFESYEEKLNDEAMFFFEKGYSQVNGKTYKGWNEEFKAMHIIERRTK